MNAAPMPHAIELAPERLRLRWPEGDVDLAAAALRAACRCADCRAAYGAGAVPVDPDVQLADAQPVGHYALQLSFSDGHARGIYPWSLLRELG